MLRQTSIVCLVIIMAQPAITEAGWPFSAEDGLRRGTPEYYAARAADPPGARQKYKYGKLWPPRARPVGPHQLFVHKYHHSHYWPFPYNCQDRAAVRNIAEIQSLNGWVTATTLHDYHFDPVTNELNSNGQEHLQWILLHAPYEYRQVHVAVSGNDEVTSARALTVEREVAKLTGAEAPVPVLTRRARPEGRPASEVHQIFTSALENMPPPMLSEEATTGSMGGGTTQ